MQREGGGLQRKASEGNASGDMSTSSGIPLQRKLTTGPSDDPLEMEADRVADQVITASASATVIGLPPRIQRFTERPSRSDCIAPPSVDRILASSGSPLEPVLRQGKGGLSSEIASGGAMWAISAKGFQLSASNGASSNPAQLGRQITHSVYVGIGK
jgi:hypothetical protein